ncbi:MAG: NifU family protein [Flavobacteriales bacterium]|nr:NifU family protein [Flavobacteriales bacterium]
MTDGTGMFQLSLGSGCRSSFRDRCSGCPSSMVTLKGGIENLMRQMVPGVKMVAEEV